MQATTVTKQARKQKKWLVYFFVLPAFLLHFVFIALPSLATVFYSFFDWNGIGQATFIGVQNYQEMFQDPEFYVALQNNFKWIAIFITVPVALGLLMALWVSKLKKSQMFFRTIYFLTYIIAAAMAGRIWCSYLNPYFGINSVFKAIGLTELGKTLWLGNKEIALYSVAFVDLWHFWGFVMVMFLGALQQVEPTLYESAKVEGASKWQEFTNITIPSIMPTLTFIVITIIMWSFLTFDYVWVMTGGGPGNASELISTLVYRNAYSFYRTGYASTICVFQTLLSVLAYAILQVVKKRGWDV